MLTYIQHLKNSLTLLCFVVSQFAFLQTTQAQPEVKNVLRGGIELLDYTTTKSGSFTKEPGYTFGYLTGVRLATDPNNPWAVLLGIELDYAKIVSYRLNVVSQYLLLDGIHRDIYDEKYSASLIEFGLSVDFRRSINEDMTIGYYLGSSFFVGVENIPRNILSQTLIDTTNKGDFNNEPPYTLDEGNFVGYVSGFAGLSFFYKRLMVDLRYRFTALGDQEGASIPIQNIYFQVGIVLF
jgi:hypothetical protein